MRMLYYLGQIFLLFSFVSCEQDSQSKSKQFLSALNNYQKDSLDKMLAQDFILKRNYTSYSNDKKDFLERYLAHSKNNNGKFLLTKIISTSNPTKLLVTDQSDFTTYLDIPSPDWIMEIYFNNSKIKWVRLDTTDSFTNYKFNAQIKSAAFDKWLSEKYPKETEADLFSDSNGLMLKRLKEYTQK